MSSIFDNIIIRDAKIAFDNALDKNEMNHNEDSELFVGKFMYMYSDNNYDYFKNKDTRYYLKIKMK